MFFMSYGTERIFTSRDFIQQEVLKFSEKQTAYLNHKMPQLWRDVMFVST